MVVMSTVSTATGSSVTKTQSPSTNTSQVKQSVTTTAKPASATTAVESVTVVSIVEQSDSFIALAPAPTETQQSQPSSTTQQQQQAPQTTQQPSSKPPQQTSEVPVKTSSISSEEPSHTIVPVVINTPTTLATLLQSTSKSSTLIPSSTSAPPSLVPLSNGSPFQGSNDGEPVAPKKNTGATIAGVVGGLSAAILLGVLGFFLWKWKTRGRYRFNKRLSFGPYGNGIDANRGGLLVSSVACKPVDSISNHEESLYSDENSPTRYDRPSFDLNREPTLPSIGDLPDRSLISPTSPPKVHFGMDQAISSSFPGQPSYRPADPMMAVTGAAPLMARPSIRQPGGGILYEPRRPPVPPSMRRNRSPPQPPAGPGMEEGDYLSRGQDPNLIPRSNSIGGQYSNRSLPALPYGALPSNGRMPMRQVRRTTSLSGMDNNRFGHSHNGNGFDPLSMHPVIPEVPSGPTTPVPRESQNVEAGAVASSPHGSITRTPVEMRRAPPPAPGPVSGRSNSLSTMRPPMPERWSSLTSDSDKPKVLTIRNPSPEREKEKESSGLGSIVRRVSNLRQEREHTVKPELAAKNF